MNIIFRETITSEDLSPLSILTTETGYFTKEEIAVAEELVTERLTKGLSSGYYFIIGEIENTIAGYSIYGPISCTCGSFDLYWIVVAKKYQNQKIGSKILEITEEKIKTKGGRKVYIETSSTNLYNNTRNFYIRRGYQQEAILKDFYKPGDSKVVYAKTL